MAFLLLTGAVGLSAACGDKLEPGTDEATEETTPTAGSNTSGSTADGNTTVAGSGNSTSGNTTTTPTGGTTTTGTSGGGTTTTPTSTGLCGTTATTISYATHIAPLVSSYCSSCHGTGGTSPTMTDYASVQSAFQNRGAKDQIDSMAMPQGRSLTSIQICLVDKWATTNYGQ